MVVTLVAGSLFAELYRLLRTPLDAGEALFAMVQPGGSVSRKIDVAGRADLLADTTGSPEVSDIGRISVSLISFASILAVQSELPVPV